MPTRRKLLTSKGGHGKKVRREVWLPGTVREGDGSEPEHSRPRPGHAFSWLVNIVNEFSKMQK